jgi:hypothetical protein
VLGALLVAPPTWAVQTLGRIRWVRADGAGPGGFGRDGRTGSSAVMAAVEQTCRAVTTSSSSSTATSGLYDCLGRADALALVS